MMALSSDTSASRRLRVFALAASMAADAAALAAAWNVAIWISIKQAVRAVMKAITAAVIAILNVNIRFCPIPHWSSEQKLIEVLHDRNPPLSGNLVADVRTSAFAARACHRPHGSGTTSFHLPGPFGQRREMAGLGH
jgi:hypothetical protein